MNEAELNQAKCADIADPWEVFFPEGYDIQGKIAYAKNICALCPVALACFTDKMKQDESDTYGIWGMTTPTERKLMRKNRRLYQLHVKKLETRAI